MKILVAPDKFKGSLTAAEVCEAVKKGITNTLSEVEVIKMPLADGGEGSLVALESALGFVREYVIVNNPRFEKIETWYGIKDNVAFIEMANASGLQLLNEDQQDPIQTTSFGTGELIVDAISKGAKHVYLFIGGSATNDAAIGIANALGYRFYDRDKNELSPIGKNLINIDSINYTPSPDLQDVKFTVLSDVQNPFYGDKGAAYVYARQKGADDKSILELDYGLRNIAKILSNELEKNISEIPSSGAAGGIGGGMYALFNAEIKSGIEAIFEMLNFDEIIMECDFVISGEGKFDLQTLEGKVVKGVIDKAKDHSKKIGVVCGINTLNENELRNFEITVKQIKSENITMEESISNAYSLLIKISGELIDDMIST